MEFCAGDNSSGKCSWRTWTPFWPITRARSRARCCPRPFTPRPRARQAFNGCTSLLAEVFSNEGIGTLIYANEYQQIRRAMKKDIRHILVLTKNSVLSDELIKRPRSAIEKNLSDYYLFEIDKNPVACVALHIYPEQMKGELAFLYVSPSHENQGIGSKLIQFVVSKARELGLNE